MNRPQQKITSDPGLTWLSNFSEELGCIKDELDQGRSLIDYRHLRKLETWGRLCTLLGHATAWIIPNPLSMWALSQGIFCRWAIVAHHVCHKGYDRIDGVPERYTSLQFARGWRRLIDWFDVMRPNAWKYEHNIMHHYHVGETPHDPDQPEHNCEFLRQSFLPLPLRYPVLLLIMVTWKWLYYAPNVIAEEYNQTQRKKLGENFQPITRKSWCLWLPWTRPGMSLWANWLPYVGWNFVAIPYITGYLAGLLLPWFGLSWFGSAAFFMLINKLGAELLTNLKSFLVIVSNHVGDDVFRFDTAQNSKDEFYLRQILGSVNYRTGSDWLTFVHGGLNYQIEHHLFPKMSLLQLSQAQPRVQELCQRYGVRYQQEALWVRCKKMIHVTVGKSSMPRYPG
jgi:fatty acid desaturase